MRYIISVSVSTLPLQVLKQTGEGGQTMKKSELTPRKIEILRAIVDAHIAGGEPVGSKYLSGDVRINCSPATIRNEMAELEEMGYLVQPHTSAGRIPSELGYRLYVETLVKKYSDTKVELDEINARLRYKMTEMDEILGEISRLASSFTDYTGIAFKTESRKARVQRFDALRLSPKDFLLAMTFGAEAMKAKKIHLSFSVGDAELRRLVDALNLYMTNLTSDELSMPLIAKIEAIMGPCGAMVDIAVRAIYETMCEMDSAHIKVEGVNKLLKYPEYSDVGRLQGLIEMLEEKDKLLDVISSNASSDDGINVFIGTENESDAMSNTTLIYKNVTVGGKKFAVGVIGPRRMNYSKVIDMIHRLAGGIDRMFREDGMLPSPREASDEGEE